MVDQRKVNVHAYELKLSYEDWSMRTILEAVLPEMPPDETETPAGFAIVGHVAHLNLRSQYLPYKNLIGQIVLDRNPNITTVINKLDSVGSEDEFRTFHTRYWPVPMTWMSTLSQQTASSNSTSPRSTGTPGSVQSICA